MTLRNIGMSEDEYLTLKKEMAEAILGANNINADENAKALAKTFNISESEAVKVLEDCNNDLRAAVKLLKVKSLEND